MHIRCYGTHLPAWLSQRLVDAACWIDREAGRFLEWSCKQADRRL